MFSSTSFFVLAFQRALQHKRSLEASDTCELPFEHSEILLSRVLLEVVTTARRGMHVGFKDVLTLL